MPELKQLSDFYDPTKAGMAALNVMQNQQHLAIQQENADRMGRHTEIQNLHTALQSANPMESYPLYAKLMAMNGQTPPGVNEYYANTNMYNKLVSATPGTPEHTDAMDRWSRTSEGSRKVIASENNDARARAGAGTLLAKAGMPTDPNTAELMRQSGPMQSQVTDALAQSELQKEKAKALEEMNQEHQRVATFANTQLSTLIPASKAAGLAIERAAPFVAMNDAVEQEYQKNVTKLGKDKAYGIRQEKMAVNQDYLQFDQRRRDSIPKLQQNLQQIEDQQTQLQSRAELIAQGVEPLKEGESLELLAGKVDTSQHQLAYARASLEFAKNPTPENHSALRNVKAEMDKTVAMLSERKKSSMESMNIRRAGLDEKIHMDQYKINREHDIGEAQVAWQESGGDPKTAYKYAKQFHVKVDEVLEGGKNPNKPLVEVHMPKTTEEAGKFAMIDNAVKSIDQVSEAITKADGSIDKAKVFASYFNIPFTEGRNIRSLTEDAISAKLRAETGAAANKDEVEGIARRFDVSPFDTQEVQKDKLRRLRRFMDETRVLRDPTGKLRETVRQATEQQKPQGQKSPASAKGKLSQEEQSELDTLRKKYGR